MGSVAGGTPNSKRSRDETQRFSGRQHWRDRGGVDTSRGGARAECSAERPSYRRRPVPAQGTRRTWECSGHHAKDPIDQLAFMADQGFRAFEDNGMARRKPEMQDKIRAALDKHKLEMGVFVAHFSQGKPTFASRDKAIVDGVLGDIRNAVEVAKRVGAKWATVVPGGYSQRVEWDYQTATVIENLKRAAEICEESGLVLVLEPLNPWRDHPGCFLSKIPQAYLLCRAVNSPSVKILFDIYHQQITEGNLIPNLERSWDEIGYIQTGDNPGRKEPGTGEINYKGVFRYIHGRGYDGILGMEHGNSKPGKEGEQAVIDAYREADSF